MAPDERGDGKVTDSSVDIINFVHEVHHFSALVEPLETIWTSVTDIRRWKSPNVTLGVWLLCNIAGFVLTKGTVFVLVAFTICLISAVSLFHVHTRILDKVLPATDAEANAVQGLAAYTPAENMQAVKEFRISLIQIYVILEQFNQKLSSFYSLLKWDDMRQSSKFHIQFCLAMLFLCVLPTRWNFLIFTNWFLLGDEKVHSYLRDHGLDKLQTFLREKSGLVALSQNGGSNTLANEKSAQDEQAVTSQGEETPVADMNSHEKEDFSLSDGEYEVGSEESGNDSDSKAESVPLKHGMVSRLLEFKRRKQQMMTGQCSGCKASFASILKRRHCCMHCGNHFCARCCFQKVPRSVFGATAPAAQTETVPVCGSCYTLLANKEGKVC